MFLTGDSMKFAKYQAIGNDYIVIAERDFSFSEIDSMYFLAQKICDRKYGVGSDDLLMTLANLILRLIFVRHS